MDRRDLGFNFDKLRISVASPADIESWSYGEVTKPETINYRTQKPERDGLFDEKIFGPTKDFECYCGKYKKIRYKGVICDKCQVEVTRSSVRRERMGHINLCIPISHIWYVRGVPSVLGMVLDKTVNELEKVIYFASYIITQVNNEIVESNLKQLEDEYQEIKKRKNVDIHVIEQQYKRTKNQLKSLAPKMLLGEEEYHEFSMKYGNVVTVGI
ncbi:DNA-directed RNA polymerase subunit beta', partial [Candidatus Berkelbacteria bacterium CG_4_9_14_3_um_filter_39_23]